MASAEHQLPTCPVCNRSDQVKTTQAAYKSGVALATPPSLPTKQVLMMPYITVGIIVVGISVFLILVLIGGLEANLPTPIMWTIATLTIISILVALSISYYAFQRVVAGDNEAASAYVGYDKAMSTWQNLYYCSNENVIFDPQTKQVLSQEQLSKLRESHFRPVQSGKPLIVIGH